MKNIFRHFFKTIATALCHKNRKHCSCYELTEKRHEEIRNLIKTMTGNLIQKQKKLEDYMCYIRDYYENILSMMPGHVYWYDLNNVYLGCNDTQAKAVGLKSRKDIVGKTNYDISWKNSAKEINASNELVIKTGKPTEVEESGILANGQRIIGLTNKAPLRDHHNKIIGVVGVSLDITKMKKLEKELKLAKKEAENANQMKTDFIRNMEHDIRTPCAGILSVSANLAKQESDPFKKESLECLAESSKMLLNYFNNLLDFSQMKSGIPILHKKFNLRHLIRDLQLLEDSIIKSKGLELKINIDDNVPEEVFGDHFRIYRILLNLLGNAIKFTNQGYVKLSIQELHQENHISTLQFIVEDTGLGISKNKQKMIFEKFARAIKPQQKKYPGSGLGLNIVKTFVNNLNGKIEIQSELNKGSQFICTIPFHIISSAQEK